MNTYQSRQDKKVWQRFGRAFCSELEFPSRTVQSDTILWIEPGPRLHRLVLFRYCSGADAHRASVNIHQSYPLQRWETVQVEGVRYKLERLFSRPHKAERLLPHEPKWATEFSFHADEAEAAGKWLGELAMYRHHPDSAEPKPQIPVIDGYQGRTLVQEILSAHGYVWTEKGNDVVSRYFACVRAHRERQRELQEAVR